MEESAEAPPAADEARRYRGSVPTASRGSGWEPADTAVSAEEKAKKITTRIGGDLCDCPQVLLSALPPTARKGECEGGTLAGSPARVQSPARRRPLLRSKSAAPETKPPLRGGFVSGASSGIYPARGYKLRLPGGKTAKEEDTKRYLPLLVPRRGFEPRTPCLKGRCSTY